MTKPKSNASKKATKSTTKQAVPQSETFFLSQAQMQALALFKAKDPERGIVSGIFIGENYAGATDGKRAIRLFHKDKPINFFAPCVLSPNFIDLFLSAAKLFYPDKLGTPIEIRVTDHPREGELDLRYLWADSMCVACECLQGKFADMNCIFPEDKPVKSLTEMLDARYYSDAVKAFKLISEWKLPKKTDLQALDFRETETQMAGFYDDGFGVQIILTTVTPADQNKAKEDAKNDKTAEMDFSKDGADLPDDPEFDEEEDE